MTPLRSLIPSSRTLRWTCLALAAALAGAVQAKVLIHHVYVGNFTSSATETQVPIELNQNGPVYSHSFYVTKSGVYLFHYSAECSVQAPAGTVNAWVDLDLADSGVVIAPTVGNTDAFCSSNGSGAYGQWARAAITVPVYFTAGQHEISLRARLNNGATGMWLGDSVTLITD